MDAEYSRRLRKIAVTIGEHTLDVFPLDTSERLGGGRRSFGECRSARLMFND